VRQTFVQFLARLPFYGLVVACVDDPGVRSIIPFMNKPVITYGIDEPADVQAVSCVFEGRTSRFHVVHKGEDMGEVLLDIPGKHNVRNALAAIAVALRLGVAMNVIASTLRDFHGVLRRFEILGEKGDVMVVQDYAHHHTEVRATLESARAGWDRRIIAVFQPHTYTRTRDFADDFGAAFSAADLVFVTDVYAAREKLIPGVSGETIVEAIRKHDHPAVYYVPSVNDIPFEVRRHLKKNDMILLLGAGDIYKAGAEIMDAL
jgi:UDP-N-acetylmuramate--alanine ligase